MPVYVEDPVGRPFSDQASDYLQGRGAAPSLGGASAGGSVPLASGGGGSGSSFDGGNSGGGVAPEGESEAAREPGSQSSQGIGDSLSFAGSGPAINRIYGSLSQGRDTEQGRLQQQESDFRSGAGASRTYESSGAQGTLSDALSGGGSVDPAISLANASYSGPGGYDRKTADSIYGNLSNLMAGAGALNTRPGLSALYKESTPGLSGGESRFEARHTLANPEHHAERNRIQSSLQGLYDRAGQQDTAATAYAEQRRGEEDEIARLSREYLMGERGKISDAVNSQVDQRNLAAGAINSAFGNFQASGDARDIRPYLPGGAALPAPAPGAAAVRREGGGALTDPLGSTIRTGSPLFPGGAPADRTAGASPVRDVAGRGTPTGPGASLQANTWDPFSTFRASQSEHALQRWNELVGQHGRAPNPGMVINSHGREVIYGGAPGQAEFQSEFSPGTVYSPKGRYGDYLPMFFNPNSETTPFGSQQWLQDSLWTPPDPRGHVTRDVGTDASRSNLATEAQRGGFNRASTILGSADRIAAPSIEYRAPSISVDQAGYQRAEDESFAKRQAEYDQRSADWAALVNSSRQRHHDNSGSDFGSMMANIGVPGIDLVAPNVGNQLGKIGEPLDPFDGPPQASLPAPVPGVPAPTPYAPPQALTATPTTSSTGSRTNRAALRR